MTAQPLNFKQISIPQWYDYKQIDQSKEGVYLRFQFLNGTIIRHLSGFAHFLPTLFQFLNGTIIRLGEGMGISAVGRFQFLNGTIISIKARRE